MAHDHFWSGDRGAGHRLALEDLPLFDSRAGEEDRAKLRKKYGDKNADLADWFVVEIADPAEELLTNHANLNSGAGSTHPFQIQ